MKKFLIITGYTLLTIVVLAYLGFLFILPNVVNLNTYKPMLQDLVKSNTDLTLDFEDVKLVTSPFLEAGVKVDKLSVKLPDNSEIFSADGIRSKVFLPAALFLTVRVSEAVVDNPKLNAEIINDEKFKIGKLYEDIVNKNREEERQKSEPSFKKEEVNAFDMSLIKIVVPSLRLNNYEVVINDLKNNHALKLQGDKLSLGYFNGKTLKLKTNAQFFSDKDKMIGAMLDIDTFLPEFAAKETVVEDDEVFALPFVNPVKMYRDYNLKTDINTKLKVRQDKKSSKIWAKGFLNIDNTKLTLSGTELPASHFDMIAKGFKHHIDTNLFVTNDEYIRILGDICYGNHPYVDMSLKSSTVHFNNLLNIAKAYLDTIHVTHDIGNMKADGYLLSNVKLKTDFKQMKSDGKFVIRNGNILHKNIGLLFNNINANLIFDNDTLNIKDTHLLINGRALSVAGQIDEDSVAKFDILADKIPLAGLYLGFAPREIKNMYDLRSGDLSLNAKITGEIKDVISLLKVNLENFVLADRAGNFVISNKFARFGFINTSGIIRGRFLNKGLSVNLPALNSNIRDEFLVANLNNKDVEIQESDIKFNQNSVLKFRGKIEDYLVSPHANIKADGYLADSDIKTVLGKDIAPYFDSNGKIPLKAEIDSEGAKLNTVIQLLASPNSYITPVKFSSLEGKQVLAQLRAEKDGDVLKLKKTGLYLRKPETPFRDKLSLNLLNSQEIFSIRAMISNLSTNPFINLFKARFYRDLDGSICVFNRSRFKLGGSLFAFGKASSPSIKGDFYVRDLSIPEIFTRVRDIDLNLASKDMRVLVKGVDVNGSDYNIDIYSRWEDLAKSRIANLKLVSRLTDVDKLMAVADALMKALPSSQTTTQTAPGKAADIPLEIMDGTINIHNIKTGNILAQNTTGNISLAKNVFYLNNLKTGTMGGRVNGNVSVDLVKYDIAAKLFGKSFDMEKVMLDVMDMRDMLSGDLSFIADINLSGLELEQQMKSLKGYVDFDIKDGQLGPFGKFENFLMAENLRENPFFSSTIGSIIKNIVTIDTSHFNNLFGHLTFNDGFAQISPIKSQGNVMSMYIAGQVGLIDNSAEMKVRGKLASAFSDSLGPLANINPVNLIKNTPGLNIVAAKSFAIFCEQVSEEEMNALPALDEGKSDDYATKFQIRLKGDTRKPLKMIKSFKWLALQSDIESAQGFVDTMPIPQPGEENLTVEELIELRAIQAAGKAQAAQPSVEQKGFLGKIKQKLKK